MPELADTSAWAVRQRTPVRAWWDRQMRAGEIGVCDMVKLELLHSTRNRQEFETLRTNLSGMPNHGMQPEIWGRVLDVYQALAGEAPQHHRSVKLPDLIIAACAESAGWTVIHYDEDFDSISEVTGQPTRWIAPRGSLE